MIKSLLVFRYHVNQIGFIFARITTFSKCLLRLLISGHVANVPGVFVTAYSCFGRYSNIHALRMVQFYLFATFIV